MRKISPRFLLKRAFCAVVLLFVSANASAQCAMCRAVLETEDGGKKAEAVNDGIVYLMMFPYLLVGIVAYAIYRLRTKKKKTPTTTSAHQP